MGEMEPRALHLTLTCSSQTPLSQHRHETSACCLYIPCPSDFPLGTFLLDVYLVFL